ncbi:MAG TPA: tRNA pseudouridine(38-40) synthase TruA [Candidatus Omnitrophica bacterium]|nr:MAG: tRNA pseudouridine(38-40) synthase TruA [Candidatus Omnitrophota bacterium]RKY34195.1 MAG: tRNA pseudouridine(38-40) synthase TruA [Candidatus Omnitrophota bacterium]RKY43840.1 MAG: tRNA pseudouridine(38-40) synthase TruA [Candidatus Omnitrophota bacterium]HEC69932.1 tRNA pseudouridine(38-40) synthase TruA [Candidatus Omnitrophota bacterium]
MLKNVYLELEYDGSNFFGWQVQNKVRNLRTVQGELEKALEKLFKKRIRVVYSGRTDRGVHAKAQVVNFKIRTRLSKVAIKKALNSLLPPDIYVRRVKFVDLDFHARFKAKFKTYRYLILNKKERDVFLRNYTWWVPQKLDLEFLQKFSSLLIGKRDFSAFTKKASQYKNCVRRIKDIKTGKRGSLIFVDICGDGFLKGMARKIVGFLVGASLSSLTLREFKSILKERKHHPLIKPAPASGLYLYKVYY